MERVALESLYHGTHDKNLKVLKQRPIKSHITLGTWLSDLDTARQYGPVIYKVTSPKRYLKLKEFYSWEDALDDAGLDEKDFEGLSEYYQSKGFDGITLRTLDGIMGVFVCLWHDYPIHLEPALSDQLRKVASIALRNMK